MASVIAEGLWVHDADDLADHVVLDCVQALTVTGERSGQVRTYAGGRRVWRGRPGRAATFTTTVRLFGGYGLAWLDVHAGRVVLVRDFDGHVVWGVYTAVPESRVGSPRRVSDVTLTVESVSRSAEV